jgi:hypothetical protein
MRARRCLMAVAGAAVLVATAWLWVGCGKGEDDGDSLTAGVPAAKAGVAPRSAAATPEGAPETGGEPLATASKADAAGSDADTTPGEEPATKPASPDKADAQSPGEPASAAAGAKAAATGSARSDQPAAGPASGTKAPSGAANGRDLVIEGTIEVASHVPNPGEQPYTECLTYLKYKVDKVVSGSYGDQELLAVFWGMRDNKLEPAAKFKKGQRQTLHLTPLQGQKDLARVMAADETDETSLPAYFVTEWSDG